MTIRGRPDPTLSQHESLYEWAGLLSRARAGCVLVCQPQDDTRALMGELSAEALKIKGARGYLVDGGCRDTEFILELGFPVFHAFFTPSDIVGRWIPDRFAEPVTIGEVTIRTGDYVLGDRDGVVVIPAELAEEAVTRTEAVAQTENLVREAIRGGMDPVDAYLKYRKF